MLANTWSGVSSSSTRQISHTIEATPTESEAMPLNTRNELGD
jgi:hypothetical protein